MEGEIGEGSIVVSIFSFPSRPNSLNFLHHSDTLTHTAVFFAFRIRAISSYVFLIFSSYDSGEAGS